MCCRSCHLQPGKHLCLLRTPGHHKPELRIYSEQGTTDYELVFQPNTAMTETSVYVWPTAKPSDQQRILASDTSGNLSWVTVSEAGGGTITAVGDVTSGAAFTSDGTQGTSLWFYDADGRGQLTIADLTAARTYTLPDASGTIALGTGTANYVAYWSGTNTLSAEQYLATSRGGTGADSSSWSGMVKVVSGTWSAVTGTADYVAYWSDANTVSAEQYLSVTRGGTGAGSFTQYGVLYGNGTNALGVTAVGTADQLLVSAGGTSAPC